MWKCDYSDLTVKPGTNVNTPLKSACVNITLNAFVFSIVLA